MNRVRIDRIGKVSANRALVGLLRVGRAHQIAVLGDRAFTLKRLDHHRPGDHEVHQIVEEWACLVDAVKSLGLTAREVRHPGGDDLQACAFEACVYLSDDILGDSVGFDDRECAFDGHGNSS